MNNLDNQYLDLLKDIRDNGVLKSDRTGTGTKSVFDRTIRFDMKDGYFPLLTTKKIHIKSFVHELLWMLSGDTNIKYLVDNGVSIWTAWPWDNYCKKRDLKKAALKSLIEKSDVHDITLTEIRMLKEELDTMPELTINEFTNKIKSDNLFAEEWGDCGPIYGKQWRQWQGWMTSSNGEIGSIWHDQILRLVHMLKTDPDSRRMIVNSWNVSELDDMLLCPCHYTFQCWTRELTRKEKIDWLFKNCYETGMERAAVEAYWKDEDFHDEYFNVPRRYISLKFTMRSTDCLLGLPFNIAFYGLLLHMLAQCTNMIPDELIFNGGDVHLYINHLEAVEEQLKREPYPLCKLKLNLPDVPKHSNHGDNEMILNYKIEDVEFIDYKSHPAIKAPIAI